MMATVELLDERIAKLEKQVYGMGKPLGPDDPPQEDSVIDNILHVNTLISSALTGRDKTNSAMKRLPELNDYLDPTTDETDLPTDAKVQLLLAMEPEIIENYNLLTKMQELMPVLETENIKDVSDLTVKLNELSLKYLGTQEELESLSADVLEGFSKYNAVITSISQSLITLDTIVTAAEKAAMPKNQVD